MKDEFFKKWIKCQTPSQRKLLLKKYNQQLSVLSQIVKVVPLNLQGLKVPKFKEWYEQPCNAKDSME